LANRNRSAARTPRYIHVIRRILPFEDRRYRSRPALRRLYIGRESAFHGTPPCGSCAVNRFKERNIRSSLVPKVFKASLGKGNRTTYPSAEPSLTPSKYSVIPSR